jgi:hypothetical protein
MTSAARRGFRPFLFAVVGALILGSAPPASGGGSPSIRLFAADPHITVQRNGQRARIDPGMWVASVGGGFHLQVARPDYVSPVDIVQLDRETGDVVQDLPEDVLDGWFGLEKVFRMTLKDEDGVRVWAKTRGWCPNEGEPQRVNDQGPEAPSYPFYCGGYHPLTRGMVWGIDEGWAVGALGWYGSVRPRVELGEHTFRMFIKQPYRTLLGIAPGDADVSITVEVKPGGPGGGEEATPGREVQEQEQVEGVPDDTTPDPATLPDLVALPAWGINTRNHNGRDLLAFGSTEWNEGPQQMVVEGFRQPGEDVMDAFQYFYQDGEPVGRAPVGTMEYHQGGGHNHWHFTQFTEYSLLDETRSEVGVSGKQSWCLVPTDGIDLTVEGAEWNPWSFGFGTSCGWETSIWVREVLDVGWGDTYFQYSAGQALDITDLPNGTYYIKVEVNPLGALYETDGANNVELRKVILKGEPGQRTVSVPPWHGIDTEGGYF